MKRFMRRIAGGTVLAFSAAVIYLYLFDKEKKARIDGVLVRTACAAGSVCNRAQGFMKRTSSGDTVAVKENQRSVDEQWNNLGL